MSERAGGVGGRVRPRAPFVKSIFVKTKLAALLTVLCCMLGIMLTVLTGNVLSAFSDYDTSIYHMSGNAFTITVVPDPAGSGPSPDRSATINRAMRQDVSHEAVTIVLDAQGGDGPRLGLYDSAGLLRGIKFSEGHDFTAKDYGSSSQMVIVNQDSYVAAHETLNVDPAASIIGHYDPKSTPFDVDYVYNLFTQQNVHGTYFVDSPDPKLVFKLAQVFQSNGYLADVQKIGSTAWSVLQNDKLTFAYEAALALVYANLILLSANYASANSRKFHIHSMYGATPSRFTARVLPSVLIASAVGTTIGIIGTIPALDSLHTLSVLPGIGQAAAVLVGNVLVVGALFGTTVTARTRRMRIR